MQRLMPLIALLLSAFALQGCKSSGAQSLSEKDRVANLNVSHEWLKAASNHNWDALAATYAVAAVLMPPNHGAISGRNSIKEFFATFPTFSDMQINPVEIVGCGGIAYVRGTYAMTIHVPNAQPIRDIGKYLEIRQRQYDGSWLIWRDIFNSDNPAPM